MNMLNRSWMIAPAAVITLALTMTACASPDAPGGSTGSSPAGPGTSVTAPSTAPTSDTDSEADATPRGTDPASCLVGSWAADNAFFLVSLREYGDEFNNVTGQVTLNFAGDGTLTTTYQDWLLTALVEGIDLSISRNGSDAGILTVDGDRIDFADTQVGSSVSVTAAGTTMPIVPEAMAYAGAAFTCAATEASITTIDGTLRLNR